MPGQHRKGEQNIEYDERYLWESFNRPFGTWAFLHGISLLKRMDTIAGSGLLRLGTSRGPLVSGIAMLGLIRMRIQGVLNIVVRSESQSISRLFGEAWFS